MSGRGGCLWPMRRCRWVAAATGIARSTIDRGTSELKAADGEAVGRIRRPGAGRKPEALRQPGLLAALEGLIEGAIRGDRQAPLRWISRSQRNIAEALRRQGFQVTKAGRAVAPRADTQNWRGKPLVSHQVIIQLISATTTDTGLTVTCDIDQGCYPKGIEVRDAEMAALNIQRDAFHGEWNYTISPRGQEPP
jgi:Rhodopirellula transposase DDE domain